MHPISSILICIHIVTIGATIRFEKIIIPFMSRDIKQFHPYQVFMVYQASENSIEQYLQTTPHPMLLFPHKALHHLKKVHNLAP